MYYAITETKVYTAKSLSLLNRSMNGLMDEDEFKQIGGDRVVFLTSSDFNFVQDKRKLSTIMFGNFFNHYNIARNLMILNIILTFIMFIRIGG